MRKIPYWLFMVFIQLVLSGNNAAQDLTFFRLDKSDGLSDNTVNSVVTDKHGLLWIGTNNGLNRYDGYSVKNFYAKNNPGLFSDNIVRMICDDKNRIWIQCGNGGLTLLDEKRQFHRIDITHNHKRISVDYILPVSAQPMFLNNGRIYGLIEKDALTFRPLEMKPEPLLRNRFERINEWDKDHLVFSGSGLLFLFDVKSLKVTKTAQVPAIVAAARVTDDIALVTCSNEDRLNKVSFASGGIGQKIQPLKDQHGEPMHMQPGSITHLHDQIFLITSPSAGVYLFDANTEILTRHTHDIFDSRTISSNHTSYISSNDDGYFFISTFGGGLNYFKLNARLAGIKTIFKDNTTEKIYGGYINDITEDAKGNIWMAGSSTLIEWKPAIGETSLRWHSKSNQQDHRGGIRTLYIDKSDRIWAGFSHALVVFSQDLEEVATLNKQSGLPDNTINEIIEAPDGSLWICTPKGICFVDPKTFAVKIPRSGSPLSEVQRKHCNTIWFRQKDEVWIGTWDGAYAINLSDGNTKRYTTENGLLFNEVIGFAGDDRGSVYIGTRMGFHILEQGKPIVAFNDVNNAWPIDCYSFVKDYSGNIWFSSNDYIVSYSPETKAFKVYDEKVGINPSGFRFYAVHAAKNGEMIFGSNKGITYFKPENISATYAPLSVLIHGVETGNKTYTFLPGENLAFPFYTRTVSFSFSAVNLLRGKNIFFQYKLEGVDKNWTATSAQRITYDNLRPGYYAFSVKASGDGLHWTNVDEPVVFRIMAPWWQQYWFIALSLFVSATAVILLARRRNMKIRQQREDLEIEQAINYLATSLHEKSNVEAILWDVAKNCIGRLQFEDCVIYLVEEERGVLVQKAAWGPKTTEESKILNPIEIPVGKGIVGSVAKNGKAEVIPDTSKDSRYIVDDAIRLSEITVPIVYEGKTLGVIDSEHSKRGFFNQKHLSILTTVASLCANKMIRAKAENEKQEAQLATLMHEREAVKAQLKSLRLQMNPHFLFNSLNSIQQMILAGEDRDATRYLSKFSRLLRLVLLHSDKENITLKEELETLNLYVELEFLRFKGSFRYDITCDGKIDREEIKIPVMLIQPFVENAIWHGLLHKQGIRSLKIEFSEDADESMICIIEDNGIGREAAGKIKNDHHTKKGIAVAMERLKTLHTHHDLKNKLQIDDIKDESGNASGTRVVLRLYQQ